MAYSQLKAWYTKQQISDWYRLRNRVVRYTTKCAMCGTHLMKGRVHVDHKVPHRGDVKLFLAPGNLQALCQHCHNSHKARHEARRLPRVGLDGWPVAD
jgi:5-methylcytosine-specific restriction endonuclease McrA